MLTNDYRYSLLEEEELDEVAPAVEAEVEEEEKAEEAI